jgi:5-methylthioribose kinase
MPLSVPAGYAPLTEAGLSVWLSRIPGLTQRLGGQPSDWHVQEVGDGNLNLVFLVDGPDGGVCVKQALPYLRLVGEGWPLGLQRAWFEQEQMRLVGPRVPGLIPALLHYDQALYAIVMEKLSPHIILRRGLIQGIRYPRFAEDIATYLALSLFHTSDLAMPSRAKKAMTADFLANWELCGLTEEVIFTDPYEDNPRNRWTSPQLDGIAAAVRADAAWKLAAARLKSRFLASPEALLHGDLHTGSIMVTETETRVIDPEFAFVGPMGFDIGAILGNLLLNALAQDGHATPDDPRNDYRDWVLATAEQVWDGFQTRFLDLWRTAATGDAWTARHFQDSAGAAALQTERQAWMQRLFTESLGFAGAKITRRILGLAHNIDLEWIADPDRRALCEVRCLHLARELMVNGGQFADMAAVSAAVRRIRSTVTTIAL